MSRQPLSKAKTAALAFCLLAMGGGAAVGALHATAGQGRFAPDAPIKAPAPAFDPPSSQTREIAVLSGGCFWGMQGVFEHVRGVTHVTAGYSGGSAMTAQYETVSTGATGHAESVKIEFDPRQVSYGQLLRIYVSVATDPTQKDRQYPDEGPQYRGEIFYATPQQKEIAQRYIAQLSAAHVFPAPIATRIDPLHGFYSAEGYHQDYLIAHPTAVYIATFDMPKLEALRRIFPEAWRANPVRF